MLVAAPERADHMAEVWIHAEGKLRKVAEPGDHSRNMINGQTIDENGTDAHRLEAAGRSSKQVAFRRPPVLAVDAADAVPAAPE